MVVSGEFNHGKSTAGILLAMWDTRFTRLLLRKYRPKEFEKLKLQFTVKDSIIISDKDPASKAIREPVPWNSYEIDEGYLWATTQQATTKKTEKLRDLIAQNRKLHPSMYWVYPNIFKMPGIMLESMMSLLHKDRVQQGILLTPSTSIQIKEKFDKKKIEKYAQKPKFFSTNMKWHSSFIFYPHTPMLRGKLWDKYLEKYDKYKVTQDDKEGIKQSNKEAFFAGIDKLLEKRVIETHSKGDLQGFIEQILLKDPESAKSAPMLSELLASEYTEWRVEKATKSLSSKLNSLLLQDIDTKLDQG